MGAIVKILIGALVMVASVWWVFGGPYLGDLLKVRPQSNLADFIIVLNGAIPPLVFLIGLFVVWLELDELRIEREVSSKKK